MSKGGDVFQIEIRVLDLQVAMAFYRKTFGWGVYQSSPNYAVADPGRMPIVGLLQDPRLPIGVAPLLLVDDCEAAVAKAKALGGRIMITRSEVAGSGAFTAALDPWGNESYFWQPFQEGRPSPKHEPVTPFIFVEIATPNLEKAIRYYSELMGWSFWQVPFTPDYAIADGCGLKRGIGLLGGEGTASGVVSYIQVPSLEETQARIEAAGGEVVVPPEQFLGEGRYIIFADPFGNRLGAIELHAP